MSVGELLTGSVFIIVVWNVYALFSAIAVESQLQTLGFNVNRWIDRNNEYGITYVMRMFITLQLTPIITVLVGVYSFVLWVPKVWNFLTTKQ